MLIQTSLIPQYITLLDRHALFWILAFNRELAVHPNGSHDLVLGYMSVTHLRMQDRLHSFLIQERDMFHHNFMWYLMTISQQSHSWRKMRFHLIGLSWLRTPARKSRRNIINSRKHGFFQTPNQETFLCPIEIRLYLSLIVNQPITISHKICLPLKHSLQLKLASQFQTR